MKKIIFLIFFSYYFCLSAQEYTYHKAQLHCHSINSDGFMSPQSVAQEYFKRGYEILFLTDHNTMTPSSQYSIPGLLTINSEECTFDKHINGFFIKHTIDASGLNAQQVIDSIRAQGGLIQFNHPVRALKNDWSYNYSQFMELNSGPDFIEIHNEGTDMIPFAKFNMNIWDSLLMSNRKIWGTFSDDMHSLKEYHLFKSIDIGWIMILTNSLSEDSVKAALLRGDFYGSNGVEISNYNVKGNEINISSTNATKIKFIGDYGKILSEVNGTVASFKRTTEKYIRIVLEKSNILGIKNDYAYTQPVFYNDSPANIILTDSILAQTSIIKTCCDTLNICFRTEKKSEVLVEIYDIKGTRILCATNILENIGYNEIPIDISFLNNGEFYYTLNIDGLSTRQKFNKI